MTAIDIWLLLAKLGISAVVVVVASILVERSGPVIGALIASLPLSSGPVYVFLAAEHGPEFLAAAALASLPAMSGIAAFQLTYVWLAQRWSTLPALAGGMLSWGVVAGSLRSTGLGVEVLGPVGMGAFALAALLARPCLGWSGRAAPARRWWDVPFRAAMVVLVAGTALTAGRLLGPDAAGLITLMPTVYVPLILILQPRIGGKDTAAMIGTALPGMIGLTMGQIALCLTAVPWGSLCALLLALGICVAWNLGLFWWKRR